MQLVLEQIVMDKTQLIVELAAGYAVNSQTIFEVLKKRNLTSRYIAMDFIALNKEKAVNEHGFDERNFITADLNDWNYEDTNEE
jgi:uncharacterized SAM-dependent methyltransferase